MGLHHPWQRCTGRHEIAVSVNSRGCQSQRPVDGRSCCDLEDDRQGNHWVGPWHRGRSGLIQKIRTQFEPRDS